MNKKSTPLLAALLLCLACCLPSSEVTAQNYENAVGLRAGWGFGVTGKHFFSESLAGEGIVRFRNTGSVNFLSLTALAQVHNSLDDVLSGLSWYYGGGATFRSVSADFLDNYTNLGLVGAIGLDIAFADLPINISLDWLPAIFFGSLGNGFGGENGGIAIRYILP